MFFCFASFRFPVVKHRLYIIYCYCQVSQVRRESLEEKCDQTAYYMQPDRIVSHHKDCMTCEYIYTFFSSFASVFRFSRRHKEASPPLSPEEQRKLACGDIALPITAAKKKGPDVVSDGQISPVKMWNRWIFLLLKVISQQASENLWKRLKRRLGLPNANEYVSIWTFQELSIVHSKCMKSASIAVRPNQFHYRFVIRAPVPWHQQVLIAREFCRHNLFMTHPVMQDIRNYWNVK